VACPANTIALPDYSVRDAVKERDAFCTMMSSGNIVSGLTQCAEEHSPGAFLQSL